MESILKYLLFYLPYELKLKTSDFDQNTKEIILHSLDFNHEDDRVGTKKYWKDEGCVDIWYHENEVKSILIPIKKRTDVIEIKGQSVIPLKITLPVIACGAVERTNTDVLEINIEK